MTLYSVYDNKTDFPVAVYADSRHCAEAMGVKLKTFYNAVSKPPKRWTICKHKRHIKPKQKRRNPVFTAASLEKVAALPDMVRVVVLADVLHITANRICKLCDMHNIPIALAGRKKIKFISRDKFMEVMKL